jgi:NodT family efflux transporter outer membrane factor (OMF) lipoprotein
MNRKLTPTLLAGALLSACAAGPDYEPPQVSSAAKGPFVSAPLGTAAGEAPDPRWWRLYDDPALEALVTQALAANTDLRVAAANLQAADAILAEARNARLPQTTLNASGGYGRNQAPFFLPDDQASFNGGVQVAYEVDLFGRVDQSIQAARADAQAQAFAQAAVRVRVVSAVAEAYLSACSMAESIGAARASIALAADSVRIIDQQAKVGAAARLDLVRAEGQLAQARAALPPLHAARQVALLELAALLGLPPSQIPDSAARCSSPPEPHRPIAVGDGASLLRRRPDVAEAERRLAAATARVGVATADLYPRVSIAASATQAGSEDIRGDRGFGYGIGPLLSFSFPNLGPARARVRQAEGRALAALATFDGVVLNALKETEQTLHAYGGAVLRRAELVEAEARAMQAFDLARLRQGAGSIAYIDVIVAQSDLLATRLARTDVDRQVVSARVGIFRALGGGWEASSPGLTASASTADLQDNWDIQ